MYNTKMSWIHESHSYILSHSVAFVAIILTRNFQLLILNAAVVIESSFITCLVFEHFMYIFHNRQPCLWFALVAMVPHNVAFPHEQVIVCTRIITH